MSGYRGVAGSGLLLVGLLIAFVAVLVPPGASAATPAAAPASASTSDDGERVFRAKGCAVCHAVSRLGIAPTFTVGPDLSPLRDEAGSRREGLSAAAYVRESIRTPQAFISPRANGQAQMPTLGLTDAEIAAVTAFLLGR